MRTTSGHIIEVIQTNGGKCITNYFASTLLNIYICLHPDISVKCRMRTFKNLTGNLYFNTKVVISFIFFVHLHCNT